MSDMGLDAPEHLRDRLVGRRTELAALTEAMTAGPTVVSLHGQSGIGKSRLLAELAAGLTEQRGEEDVVVIDCREVTSIAELVDQLERSSRHAAATRILIDHADRLHDDLPDLVRSLVSRRGAACVVAGVRRLGFATTSLALGPLAVPESDEAPATPTEAMELFAARVTDLSPGFILDEETAALLTVLVRRLGGIPLAVELAAARHGLLGLRDLVRMVDDTTTGIDVLGAPTADRRTSMAAALAWSIQQLDPAARDLLVALGVFETDVDTIAIARVGSGELADVLDALSTLVDLRLVDPVDPAGLPQGTRRFRLSPLVAAAARRHHSPDSISVLRDRHAAHFTGAAARGAALMLDGRESAVAPSLLRDLDEVLRAVTWLGQTGRVEEALHGAADLALLHSPRASVAQMLPILEALLAQGEDVASEHALARGRLAAATSSLAVATGPDESRRALAWWKLAAGALGDDDPLLALWAHAVRVKALPVTGDFSGATAAVEAGIELAEHIGHAVWQARFEAWSGMVHHQLRDFPQAVAIGERALRRSLATGDRTAQIRAGLLLHLIPPEEWEGSALLPSLEVLLGHADALGDLAIQRRLLAGLVLTAVRDDDARAADLWMGRLLGQVHPLWGDRETAGVLLMTVLWALVHQRHRDVARLRGAIRPWEEVTLAWLPPLTADHFWRAVDDARVALGNEVFAAEDATGAQAGIDANLRFARAAVAAASASPSDGTAGTTTPASAPLTPRESQVLGHLVEGLRNKEIAERLGTTTKSVMHHTSAIYRKLGVRGRAEAVAHALRT